MPKSNRFGAKIDTGLPCQLEITPIVPVRFSLTKSAIENTTNNIIPKWPEKIGAPDYQLRRLRQGYLYIYAVSGAMVGSSSDGTDGKTGKWQVFEYYVSDDDSNGSLMLDKVNLALGKIKSSLGYAEEKRVGQRYHFRKYSWEQGSAKGQWTLDNQSYPYAFVSSQVSLIDYAYSERRWPAELFELLESEEIRKTVMQRAWLKPENSTYSFPFAQITEKVADFNPDQQQYIQDKADSYTRRTALGYNQKHEIKISNEAEKKRARVIVVHDPIGDIADVSCFNEYMWANLINDQQKYLYATTTARATKSIASQLRESIFKDYPIDEQNTPTRDEYASQDFFSQKAQTIVTKLQNIAKTQIAMIEQAGNFTLHQQLKLVTTQVVNFTKNIPERLNAVNAYAASLAYGAFQQLAISTQGMEELAMALSKDKPYGGYVEAILKMAEKVTTGYALSATAGALKRLELEVLCETVMTAQFYRWSSIQLGTQSITQETYLAAFGLRRGFLRVNGTGDIYSMHLEEQTRAFVQNKVELSRTPGFNSAIQETVTGKQIHSKQGYVVLIGLDGEKNAQALQNKLHITHKAGIFFSTMALRDSLDSFQEDPDNVLLNPILQTSANLAGFIAAFNYDRNGILNTAIKNMAKGANSRLASFFSRNHVLVQRFGAIAEGSGSLSSRIYSVIGHTANVLGLLVTIGQGIKAQRKNDKAALASATLAGLSEVAFIVAHLGWLGASAATPLIVVGLVLLLASLVIYQFIDNDYESWVRTGFWGNSTEYWLQKRDQLPTILEDAEILSSPYSKDYQRINTFFNKEMTDFYNLIWGLTIQNNIPGDNKLRILSPAFTEPTSANKLTVKWRQITFWIETGERGKQYSDLDTSKIKKNWLYNGCIELDFSQAARLNPAIQPDIHNRGRKLAMLLGELIVTYPHLGNNAKGVFMQHQLFGRDEI